MLLRVLSVLAACGCVSLGDAQVRTVRFARRTAAAISPLPQHCCSSQCRCCSSALRDCSMMRRHQVVINEVMANPDDGHAEEWAELCGLLLDNQCCNVFSPSFCL